MNGGGATGSRRLGRTGDQRRPQPRSACGKLRGRDRHGITWESTARGIAGRPHLRGLLRQGSGAAERQQACPVPPTLGQLRRQPDRERPVDALPSRFPPEVAVALFNLRCADTATRESPRYRAAPSTPDGSTGTGAGGAAPCTRESPGYRAAPSTPDGSTGTGAGGRALYKRVSGVPPGAPRCPPFAFHAGNVTFPPLQCFLS
jgi:hypothetical protein